MQDQVAGRVRSCSSRGTFFAPSRSLHIKYRLDSHCISIIVVRYTHYFQNNPFEISFRVIPSLLIHFRGQIRSCHCNCTISSIIENVVGRDGALLVQLLWFYSIIICALVIGHSYVLYAILCPNENLLICKSML